MNGSKRLLPIGFLAAVAGLFVAVSLASADENVTVDLEGLPEGHVVMNLSTGNGVSGAAVPGQIDVSTDSNGSVDSAIVFDATCHGGAPGDCTGGDSDLYQPAQGNVLIIAENNVDTSPADGNYDNPDDESQGGTITFDFSNFTFGAPGTGTVTPVDVQILDVEETGGEIRLYDSSDNLIGTVPIPSVGNGEIETLDLGSISGVARIEVQFAGSGASDDWNLQVPGAPPSETPSETPTETPTESPSPYIPDPDPDNFPKFEGTPVPEPSPSPTVVTEVESAVFQPPETGTGGLR